MAAKKKKSVKPDARLAALKRASAKLQEQLGERTAERDGARKQNARLKKDLRSSGDRQAASAEILRTVAAASGDAGRALQQIAQTSARLFGASSVSIQLEKDGEWGEAARFGDSANHIRVVVPLAKIRIGGRSLPGTVIARNGQIHIPDLDHLDPDTADWPGLPPARKAGTRTMCGTPLRRDGDAIGVLIVYRDRLLPFTDEELALQQSFADQAVIAIENARLFNETREALERQTATAEILKVIASSPSDVQPVFDAIAASSNRLIGGSSTAVHRIIDDALHLAAFTRTTPAGDAALQASFPRPLSSAPWGENIRNGETVHIPDAEIEWAGQPTLLEMARLRGFRSLLFVPLLRDGTTIGLISVTRKGTGRFSPHHVQLLQTFADQAVIAIENTRLFNETREALERQTVTADILKVIASSPSDVQPVFDAIVGSAAKLFEPCSATITTLKDDKLYWNATAASISGFDVDRVRTVYPIPFDQERSPSTRAILERRIIEIPDVAAPDTPEFTRNAAAAGGFQSITFVPLIDREQGIGTIIFTNPQTGFRFSERRLALIQTFADQAVIAIQNTRLFNETQEALERQTATAEILKVIASSPADTTPVFAAIAASADRLLDGFSAAVFRFIDGNVHLAAFTPVSPAADAALKADFPTPVEQFEAFRLAQQGKPFPIPDTEEIPHLPIREIARLHGFRSMLFVPLMNGGVPIGIISVTRLHPGAFSSNHIQLLQTFADQAVIAIENTRLFNETQEALERQTATADILKVIASSPSDVQPVFDAIAASSKQLIGGFSATVFRFIDGIVNLVAYTPVGPAADEVLKTSFPRPTANLPFFELAKGGEVVQEPDSEDNPDTRLRDVARARGFRSSMFAPLMSKGTPIGLIVVTRKEPGTFAGHHVQLLRTFADQAVIAIENVRLFDEVQARTRDLQESLEYQIATSEVLQVISRSTFDLQPVLDTLVESAYKLCGAKLGLLYLRGDETFECKAIAGAGVAEASAIFKGRPIRAGRGTAAERVILTGEIQSVTDFFEDPDFDPRVRETIQNASVSGATIGQLRSTLAVPMTRDGTVIGVIAIARSQTGPFPQRQIELLQTFADQAVIAIENVRLFDEVQAKTRDLTEALTYQTGSGNILRVIASSPTDVDPVLRAIVESACELCEADDALVTMRDGDDLLFKAQHGSIPVVWEKMPINRQWASGRAVVDRKPVHVHDLLANEGEPFPDSQEFARRTKVRTVLSVPLLRENESIGAIVLRRTEVKPFSDKQIALLQTFADQAVIAIGNVRLFEEVQARTRELSASLDDLRTAQDRLVQTEKLASLGQLTAGIAHEIKNPLNFVNNFSALSAELVDELNDTLKPAALESKMRGEVDELTQMLKGNLEKVVQHGKRADSIVKNMLLHSREGSGDHRPADINALLDESLNLAYHGARAEKREFNVTLQREFDEAAGEAEVFPQEITRVFLNLISNGFYAVTKRKTEDGGAGFEPRLKASTRNLGETVEIRIRDNGTGIPAEVREKMFNPFFTTKPAGEGTGLGLSMSHDIIVKQHGGTIDVETEPGQFTEFRIVLPRTSHSLQEKKRGQT